MEEKPKDKKGVVTIDESLQWLGYSLDQIKGMTAEQKQEIIAPFLQTNTEKSKTDDETSSKKTAISTPKAILEEKTTITKEEYENFVKTGQIPENVLVKIAQKIKKGEQLFSKEIDVYVKYREEIKNIGKNKPETPVKKETGWAFADLPKGEKTPTSKKQEDLEEIDIDLDSISTSKSEKINPEEIPIEEEITSKTPEEKEVLKEIENLPPADRGKIGWGLSTLGFKVEKIKDDFFAGIFNAALEGYEIGGIKLAGIGEEGRGKFYKELRDSFRRDAEVAEKKARGIVSGKEKHRFSNTMFLLGNVLKYGRIVADVTGASIANPFRYVMMGGMAMARLAEAGKEARLKSERVMEKTRIQDAERAAEEAWGIYKKAQRKEGEENVSAESLKKAYLREMPRDLLRRLGDTSTANTFIQKIIKAQIDLSITGLSEKLDEIYLDEKLSETDKEKANEKLFRKWEKDLEDYDRVVTQYGTVDGLAMAGRYAQKIGRGIVLGMQIETALVSAEKLCETVSNIFHHFHDAHEILTSQPPEKGFNVPAHEAAPETSNIETPAHPLENQDIHAQGEVGVIGAQAVAPNAHENIINPDAIVHKGEGIEHAFIRQIEHNPKLAAELGFKGEVGDAKALHAFAGREAHILATNEGYIGNHGQEVRVLDGDKTAYEIKMENGHPIINERTTDGTIIETHHEGDVFEKETEQYEYRSAGHQEPMHSDVAPAVPKTPMLEHPAVAEPTPAVSNLHPDDTAETLKAQIAEKINMAEKPPIGHPISELSPAQNDLLSQHPEFTNNLFHLTGDKLMQAYEASQKNINFLFGREAPAVWENLKDYTATTAMKHTSLTDGKISAGILGDYLSLLKNFSGLAPKDHLINGPETIGPYVARALQKLTAEGKLEIFQESLRK